MQVKAVNNVCRYIALHTQASVHVPWTVHIPPTDSYTYDLLSPWYVIFQCFYIKEKWQNV